MNVNHGHLIITDRQKKTFTSFTYINTKNVMRYLNAWRIISRRTAATRTWIGAICRRIRPKVTISNRITIFQITFQSNHLFNSPFYQTIFCTPIIDLFKSHKIWCEKYFFFFYKNPCDFISLGIDTAAHNKEIITGEKWENFLGKILL